MSPRVAAAGKEEQRWFNLRCSCGWCQQTSTRPSATMWKRWHREQHTPKGSRLSESGHDVTITRGAQ